MQLHPKNTDDWNREKELLEALEMIGIDSSENSQSKQFKEMIQLGDIVLIKHRQQPVALVSIEGESQINSTKDDLHWFAFERKIKVLDFFPSDKKLDFLLPAARLSKSIDKSSETFKFIDTWHKQVIAREYSEYIKTIQKDITLDQYKIKSLSIENLKMFSDFELSFVDANNVALPIVVIAGKNGTGKTTILQFLSDYNLESNDYIEIFQTRKPRGLAEFFAYQQEDIVIDIFKLYKTFEGILAKKSEYKEHIEYLPVMVGDVGNVEEKIVNYYITNAEKLDSFKDSLENIKKYINDIFKDLELSFSISKIDYKEKKVFLKNGGKKEFSINELSTGEKTLVSKILYLYFNEIKNKIVLIDEPELSLHPSWQNRVLKLYENFAIENNCQIIIATHSPHIIAQTPHKYLRLLAEENGKIVAKQLTNTPLDRDVNTIIKTIMGADYIPKWLEEKHFKYRKLCENGKEDSEEAEKLKSEILEYESPNSSFFQGLAFDMELMR